MCKRVLMVSFFILLSPSHLVFSQQTIAPGGVTDPLYWLKSKTYGDEYLWDSPIKNKPSNLDLAQKGILFNFNPSIALDGEQDSIVLPLGLQSKKKQTFFLVYKAKDSLKEQVLWSLTAPKQTVAIATNQRLADLKQYSYQSYEQKIKPQKANIHFFQQNKTDSIANFSFLSIGLKPKKSNLPPSNFEGAISEVLVYDRVLSAVETQKVASYLGIKYGISLSQFELKDYLNSRGETIWDSDKHKGFDSSITGIGRDDASGLLQPKSTNMLNEGLLTIEMKSKSDQIPNNYFAFWSDNGKSLKAKKQEQGTPMSIARHWQLDYHSNEDITLDWSFNPKFIEGDLAPDTYYWLLIDYSGKGTYKREESEYVCLGSTSSLDNLRFSDFNFAKQSSSTIAFTLQIAPKMFSKVWITQASCGVVSSGELQYSIEGGEAPYTITVSKTGSSEVLKQWSQTAKNGTAMKLSSGTYDYIVRDSKGNIYSDTVFVSDKDGTVPTLKSNYSIAEGESLELDASAALPIDQYQYEWYYENNLISTEATLTVTQTGSYELRLTNGQQCKTATKIEVESNGKRSDTTVVMAYPNPITDGNFSVSMQYPAKTPVTVEIYSASGILIKKTKLVPIDTYQYNDSLSTSGFYLVTVRSDFGTKTFKMIVN